MKQKPDTTQAIEVPVPVWKRGRFVALVTFALGLVLWEVDAKCDGRLMGYFKLALDWIMAHPVIPCGVSLLVGHYCWPEEKRLVRVRNHVKSHSDESSDESSLDTRISNSERLDEDKGRFPVR